MTVLDRRIGQARRRLTVNLLTQRLAVGVLIATGAWTLVLLVERAFVLGLPILHGVWVGALVAGTIALVGTALARVRPLVAAAALDRAAGLKERVSSALLVYRDPDPFARAVVRDAETKVGSIHLPTHLPYRAPALWPWSVAGVLAAALLGLFVPNLNLLASQKNEDAGEKRVLADAERLNINRELEDRRNKIRQMAENNPALDDLARDLQPLEMPDTPTLTPEDVRREAAKKLDKVTDRLVETKEEAGLDALRDTQRMFSRLEPQSGQNPAAELSRSLAAGDFEGARKALDQLRQDIQEAAAKADPESQQRIAQMQSQLKKLADQLAELDDALYLQKELENKGGLSPEAAKKLAEELSKLDPKQLEKELQRQLADKGLSPEQIKELVKKIQQQQQAKKNCQNMGQCLAQAAQALQQCNSPGSGSGAGQAAAALSDAMNQMSQLEMSEQLVRELEAQLSDLRALRDSVCRGPGQGRCGRPGDNLGPQGPNLGYGIGSNVGKERTPHNLDPTRARTQVQGGTIIGQTLVDGPQIRGQATAEEREAINAAQRDAQDAIDRDVVPRQYHGAVQKYFEQLAGLLRTVDKPAERPAEKPEPKPKP